MKMKNIVICAILIFTLASYAYGFGSHGGHHDREYYHYRQYYGAGSTNPDHSGENWATVGGFNTTANGDSVPVAVPEPSTMLLLGSGLVGLLGLRRKFKK